MENFWVKNAEKIENLKKEHMFTCFAKDLAGKCSSDEELLIEIKRFRDMAPVDSFGEAFERILKYGDKSNYNIANISRLAGQLYRTIEPDEIYKKLTEHSNHVFAYFDKIIHQKPQEELKIFWEYVNSLQTDSTD